MIAVTSLAPGHKNKDNQKAAIQSWKDAGFKVYSINSTEEIEKLQDYDVAFLITTSTGENEYAKPYVRFDAFRDFVKKHGDALVINSDILITGEIKTAIENAKTGMLMLSRYDYDEDMTKAKMFRSGFDAFYLRKEHAVLIPDTRLALGQCHWDYWLPMTMLNNRVSLFTAKRIIIMHKKHDLQYSMESWYNTAHIFMRELGFQGRPEYASTAAYNKITARLNVVW